MRKPSRAASDPNKYEDAFEKSIEHLTDYQKVKREFLRQRTLNAQFAKPGPLPFIIILDNMKANFNIGKIFRSAEVFGCREVHLIGTKEFNPYPSKGGFRHVPAKFFESFRPSYEALVANGYTIYVLEPDAPEFLGTAPLSPQSAFVVGHEFKGISFNKAEFPAVVPLKIRQLGKTQSLNAAVAASLAMYEYGRQFSGEAHATPIE